MEDGALIWTSRWECNVLPWAQTYQIVWGKGLQKFAKGLNEPHIYRIQYHVEANLLPATTLISVTSYLKLHNAIIK
jgi:hypothetical protein